MEQQPSWSTSTSTPRHKETFTYTRSSNARVRRYSNHFLPNAGGATHQSKTDLEVHRLQFEMANHDFMPILEQQVCIDFNLTHNLDNQATTLKEYHDCFQSIGCLIESILYNLTKKLILS